MRGLPLSLSVRRPPTRLERLLGKRRVRRLRRRLGLVALGTGFVLVKPSVGWARVGVVLGFAAAAVAGVAFWAL